MFSPPEWEIEPKCLSAAADDSSYFLANFNDEIE